MAPSATATLPEGSGLISSDEVSRPFPPLDVNLSDEELRQTAYEIFVAATRVSSNGRPLSTGWRSRSINGQERSPDSPLPSGSALVKRAFGGMRLSRPIEKEHSNGTKMKGSSTGADIVRMQLGISDKYDASLRRVLSRTDVKQVGKGIENLLVPLNLLQNMHLSEFSSHKDYERWRRRQLIVLEAGLLAHPKVALSGADIDWQRVKQLFKEFNEKSVESSKGDKSMQTLRNGIVELACRAGENEADDEVCHWADGFPLNVHLYQMLVASCFDSLNEGAVIDEIEEVMELIKKTWGTLGITQRLHNICFAWTLFHQFVITGQKEIEHLAATKTELKEVEKDVKSERDPVVVKVLVSALGSMQAWSEKRLLAYHDAFPQVGNGLMEYTLPVAILAAQILHENTSFDFRLRQKEQSDVASTKINLYIRSSLRTAFAQMMDEVAARRRPSKVSGAPPALVVLARRTADLAKSEREKFSPILSLWHPYPAGVAAATLHSCYRRELHQFITRLKILTPEAVQVAESAEQLEQDLVQIAVEDTVDCEDGGKKIVREMSPFDAHTVIAELSQKWLEASLAKLYEWVNRNVKNEDWSPHSLREHYAPSAVEVLRMVEETLDAFFSLPISEHPNILQDLIDGVDRGLQLYVSETVGTFGSEKEFMPRLPPLTRWNKESLKSHGKGSSHWWKKDTNKHFFKKEKRQPRSSEELQSEISDLERLCVRINTLYYLQSELEGFEKKIRYGWQKSSSKGFETGKKPILPIDQSKTSKFELVREGCKGGIQNLIGVAVHKAIFQNMRSVFWEGLYSGEVANSRVDQVIPFLDAYLETIATTVSVRLRNRFVTALMRASFEGFLLVLLAGGPSRSFEIADADILEEDFVVLKDLFKADGDGLPEETVETAAMLVAQILSLFSMETCNLIDTLRAASSENPASISTKSMTSPSTMGLWSPTDASTLLRVLCYRADVQATRFLRKAYNLPKR